MNNKDPISVWDNCEITCTNPSSDVDITYEELWDENTYKKIVSIIKHYEQDWWSSNYNTVKASDLVVEKEILKNTQILVDYLKLYDMYICGGFPRRLLLSQFKEDVSDMDIFNLRNESNEQFFELVCHIVMGLTDIINVGKNELNERLLSFKNNHKLYYPNIINIKDPEICSKFGVSFIQFVNSPKMKFEHIHDILNSFDFNVTKVAFLDYNEVLVNSSFNCSLKDKKYSSNLFPSNILRIFNIGRNCNYMKMVKRINKYLNKGYYLSNESEYIMIDFFEECVKMMQKEYPEKKRRIKSHLSSNTNTYKNDLFLKYMGKFYSIKNRDIDVNCDLLNYIS